MRYDSVETTILLGELPSGGAVTVSVTRVSSGAAVTITGSSTATELGTTGVYKWATTNVATWPASDIYLVRFTDGSSTYNVQYERGLGMPETVRVNLDATVGTRATQATAKQADRASRKPIFHYAGTPILPRGITAGVIARGSPSYVEWRISATRNFAAPDEIVYDIYTYDTSGRVEFVDVSGSPPNP